MIQFVVSCEHASWTLPPGEDLDVSTATLMSQAGWDHGALDIADILGRAWDVRVHAGSHTRVWVDLNRDPDHVDVVPTICYGAVIPGNHGLSPEQRATRIATWHAPYWNAVRRDIASKLATGARVIHISSHSFSPELDPDNRRFDVGVLFDDTSPFETELAAHLMHDFAAADLRVRANLPYTGVGPALVTAMRAEFSRAHYAGIEIETSHAMTHTDGGTARVAEALRKSLDAFRNGDASTLPKLGT